MMVQVYDRHEDFGGVGPATVFTETTRTDKMEDWVTTWKEFGHEVQLARGLKRIVDLDNERVGDNL